MANDQTQVVFEWKGRPCMVLGEQMQEHWFNGQCRHYLAVQVRFLDSAVPERVLIGKKTWGRQGKVIKGVQALVWQRVRELTDEGLTANLARRQAVAELNKGVLAAGVL